MLREVYSLLISSKEFFPKAGEELAKVEKLLRHIGVTPPEKRQERGSRDSTKSSSSSSSAAAEGE